MASTIDRQPRRRPGDPTDDRRHRGAGRRLGADRLEGHQRPARTCRPRPGDASRRPSGSTATPARNGRRGRHRSSRSSSTNSRASGRWRSSGASSGSPASTSSRSSSRRCRAAGRRAAAGSRASSPAGRRASSRSSRDLSEAVRAQLRASGHPVRRGRPDGRAAPRHAVDRGDQLERRPDGDPPPARPRASPDRRSSAARSGSCAAARGWTATAPRWTRPGSPVDPRLISHGDFHVEEGIERGPGAAAPAPIRRPRSSPATTSRRSASTRPRARRGCTSPRTSASSGSTTCRSRAGSVRR